MERSNPWTVTLLSIALPVCALGACADGDPYGPTDVDDRAAPSTVETDWFDTPWGPRQLTYELIGGRRIFQGDIILPEPIRRGAVRRAGSARWPRGVVPYSLGDFPAGDVRPGRIADAIAMWDETPIRFVDIEGDEWEGPVPAARVKFVPTTADECSSESVGNQGYLQEVTLGVDCFRHAVAHEIGHVLGLYHEQARTDRDEHVEIHWSNVEPGKEHNFETYVERTEVQENDGKNFGPYDLTSIMQYDSFAFSIAEGDDEAYTITLTDGETTFEENTEPSATDLCAVTKFNGFSTRSDVDGDGAADLLVGSPYEDLASGDEGILTVVYGGETLELSAGQIYHRDPSGAGDTAAAAGDGFGASVAAGDFNGDCLADVAVGVPYDDVGGVADAGSVDVFHGSEDGLGEAVVRLVAGSSATGDTFGQVLAVGDFNSDGYDDLAVGAPWDDLGSLVDAGSVTVFHGSPSGLSPDGDQIWTQNDEGLKDVAEASDYFGFALATGDLDGDSHEDLAIGVPYEDVGGLDGAGMVHIVFGGPSGLSATNAVTYFEGPDGVGGVPSSGDNFGFSLAAGDFAGDGFAGLAIGQPWQQAGALRGAGAVTLVQRLPEGSTSAFAAVEWSQSSPGTDASEAYELFGHALRAADFDADGRDDLAVGVPLQDVAGEQNAGAVHVFYMADAGITGVPTDQVWSQASSNIDDIPETDDLMGSSLQVGDYRGDGTPDLAIGVPWESVGSTGGAGAVHVIGNDPDDDQVLLSVGVLVTQEPENIPDSAEAGDRFGFAL